MGHYGRIWPVLMLSPEKVANAAMLDIWSQHFIHIQSPVLEILLRPFTYFRRLQISTVESVAGRGEPALYPLVNGDWRRPPIFKLPDHLIANGEEALRAMGLPLGRWHVCFHARDGVYSPGDEYLHVFRNASIENYELAADEIIARGGWCVRMGEAGSPSLRERAGVINYHRSEFKSDWMDLFLCTRARFFLGTASGLCNVSTIVDVPSALANMAPLGACLGFGADDLGIPTMIARKNGEVLSWAEIMGSDISLFRLNPQYERAGLETIENSPEEIRDLALEMLDWIEATLLRSPDDEMLQQRFRALMQPKHYCYATPSRIGSAFLRSHRSMLEERS